MKKKCIPGLICVENMTLFLLFVILLFVIFLFFKFNNNNEKILFISNPSNISQTLPTSFPEFNTSVPSATPLHLQQSAIIAPIQSISTRNDPFNDPYQPPLKTNDLFYPIINSREASQYSSQLRLQTPGIPINIETNGISISYSQIGILTRNQNKDDLILPLMGRRIVNGRDKWQYYTISNNGNINTKLPIIFNGKNCTSDLGCNELNNNDVVFVEGYKDKFIATIYENNKISYIPYI